MTGDAPQPTGRRWRVAALGLLVALCQLPAWRTGLYVADEGWTVHIAERIARGEVLYRDVHTYLPPLVYWCLVPGMALSPSLVWGRLLMLAACAAMGAAAALWGVDRGRLAPAVGVAGLALLAAGGYPSYTIPSYTGLSVACLMLALALWDGGAGAAWCGGLLACALLFKQTTGALGLAALLAAQLLEPRLAWRRLAAGLAAVLGAAALLLAIQGSLGPMAAALSPATLARYGSFGTVPFPTWADLATPRLATTIPTLVDVAPWVLADPMAFPVSRAVTWLLYVGPVPLAILFAALSPPGRRRRDAALAAGASLCYVALWPRADVTHLLQVLPPAAVLGGLLLARLPRRLATAVAALLMAAALGVNAARRAHAATPLDVPRDGGLRVPAEVAGARRIILELRRRPGKPMLAAPWGALYYFLADRPNPTRYELLLPGNIGPEEQRDVLATLRGRPPVDVVWSPVDLRQLTPVSFEEFYPELVRWRDAGYRRVAAEGGDELWQRSP